MISEKMQKLWTDGKVSLLTEHLELDICEIHGFICGLIAGGSNNDASEYMKNINNLLNSGEPFSGEMKEWIQDMYSEVRSQYHDMETLEYPFEEELTDQETAVYYLGQWAETFLLGFGCVINRDEMDDSGKELIDEISNFTQIEVGDNMESEELDEMLTTLLEHLKVCAMSLYADYGFKTDGKIVIPKEIQNNKYTKDGELVIGDEGISISDLQ